MWRYGYPTTSGHFPRLILALALLFVSGCNLVAGPQQAETLQDIPVPTPRAPEADANEVLAGICFESALDAAGQLFVFRNAAELATFFDLADNSRLCRQPVARQTPDFSDGRVLAGIWSAGQGCEARHEVLRWRRDDAARQFFLQLRLIVDGDCNYELVQPWWMTLENASEFDIVIEVLP